MTCPPKPAGACGNIFIATESQEGECAAGRPGVMGGEVFHGEEVSVDFGPEKINSSICTLDDEAQTAEAVIESESLADGLVVTVVLVDFEQCGGEQVTRLTFVDRVAQVDIVSHTWVIRVLPTDDVGRRYI